MSNLLFLTPSNEPCSRCGGVEGVRTVVEIVNEQVVLRGQVLHEACRQESPETLTVELLEAPPQKGGVSRERKRRANKQERDLANTIGGKQQKGSGSQLHAKGDVRKKGVFRVECKSTTAQSFSMKREILDKISSECLGMERPALDVLFLNDKTLREEDRWVAIPFLHFEEYVDYVTSKNQRSAKG